MTATTIDEFWALGGRWRELKNDVQRGFCTLDAEALEAAWQEFDAGPKTGVVLRDRGDRRYA